MKPAAIFLDRDGTIIEDLGYLKNIQNVEFIPDVFTSLLQLQEHFLLFIITNQSGISKGITTAEEVSEVNSHIVEELRLKGIVIFEVFCCPHTSDDNCMCKKPKPFFIQHAAELYNLDLKKSFIIGDHPSDVECGLNSGVTPIYVLTGHGEKHKDDLKYNCLISENIFEASKHILVTRNHNDDELFLQFAL